MSWLDGGVPLHQVQASLGHTNISQTSTYLAVTDQGGDLAMARFDALRAEKPAVEEEKPTEGQPEDLQESCREESEKWSGRVIAGHRPLGPETASNYGC